VLYKCTFTLPYLTFNDCNNDDDDGGDAAAAAEHIDMLVPLTTV